MGVKFGMEEGTSSMPNFTPIGETEYNLCKFCENRARDTPLWGVYIPHFDQISAKF